MDSSWVSFKDSGLFSERRPGLYVDSRGRGTAGMLSDLLEVTCCTLKRENRRGGTTLEGGR